MKFAFLFSDEQKCLKLVCSLPHMDLLLVVFIFISVEDDMLEVYYGVSFFSYKLF